MALALRHPEQVAGLVLVSTAPRSTPSRPLVAALLRIARPLKRRTAAEQRGVLRQFAASRDFDGTARLGEIAAPTLILHGRRDRITPFHFAQEMAAAIPGARLVPLRGGHLTLFWHPGPPLQAVAQFLAATAQPKG